MDQYTPEAQRKTETIFRSTMAIHCKHRWIVESYVEQRDGGYYVAGTRISLDSIIYPFKSGASPEAILRSFPLIGSLEKVYGAITFYLANRELIENYLCEQERLSQELAAKESPLPKSLSNKVNRAREEALPR